jgi:hypothetical protein
LLAQKCGKLRWFEAVGVGPEENAVAYIIPFGVEAFQHADDLLIISYLSPGRDVPVLGFGEGKLIFIKSLCVILLAGVVFPAELHSARDSGDVCACLDCLQDVGGGFQVVVTLTMLICHG